MGGEVVSGGQGIPLNIPLQECDKMAVAMFNVTFF